MSDIKVGVDVGSVAPVEQLSSSLDRLTAAMKRLPAASNLDTVARSLESLRGSTSGTSANLSGEADKLKTQLDKVLRTYADYDRRLSERLRQNSGVLTANSKAVLSEMQESILSQELQIEAGGRKLAAAIAQAGAFEAAAIREAAALKAYTAAAAAKVSAAASATAQADFIATARKQQNYSRFPSGATGAVSANSLLGIQPYTGSSNGESMREALKGSTLKEAVSGASSLGRTLMLPPDASKLPAIISHLGQFTLSSNDAHSAVRGLASGFGALWLTWGSVIPLLAGAAISNSFVQMVKMGADVQHTFETIRVLSEESSQSVAALNAQMLELARTGPFGPREVAEAMKTLSLAGLNAGEVSSSIKDVLNFAEAGTTSTKTAADVMTSVASAFKVSADGYNYVGDVISKTAAVSKASVETMGEAFKTATVLNSLYGVSLEDVGTGLALLANTGIQGSAAGTALRNFYTDISGRTPKATAALKQLGVEAFDSTGKVKSFADIFSQLDSGLANFDRNSQRRLLSDAFTERGAKPAQTALDALRENADKTGQTVRSILADIQLKIENAAGFMAVSSVQLALTPLNQMKSVMATLQATLVEGFDGLQPYILETSDRLKTAFNSEEFKTALQTIARLLGSLTALLAEHLNQVLLVAAGYVALKVVGVVASLVDGFSAKLVLGAAALATNTQATLVNASAHGTLAAARAQAAAADGAAAVAGAAAGGRAIGLLATTLSWVSRTVPWVTALWGAWELYSIWAGKSAEKSAGVTDNKALLESLKAEAARLREINEARALNITLEDLQQRKKASAYQDNAGLGVKDAENELARMQKLASDTEDPATRARRLNRVKAQEVEVQRQKDLRNSAMLNLQTAKNEVSIEAELIKAAEKAKEATRRGNIPDGTKDYQKAGGLAPHMAAADSNPFNNYSKLYDNELKQVKRTYDLDVQANDDRLKAKLISEGEHSAALARILGAREDKANEILGRESAQDRDAYVKAVKDVQAEPTSKYYGQSDREKQMRDLQDNYAKALSDLQDKRAATNDAVAASERKAAAESSGHAAKLKEEFEDYWRAEDGKLKKLAEEQALRERLLSLNPAEAAAAQASLDATSRHSEFILRLDKQYIKAEQDLQALKQAQLALDLSGASPSDGAVVRTDRLAAQAQRELDILRDQIADAKAKSNSAGAAAAGYAYTKAIDDKRREIVTSVAESISEGIFNGGKLSAKSLADYLRKQLIQKPFTIMLNGLLDSITGPGGMLGGLATGLAKGALGGAGGFAGMLGLGGSTPAPVAEADFYGGLFDNFTGMGSFAVGTPYVPKDMIAQIHEGEAIVPAKWNNSDTFGGNSSVTIVQHNRIDGTTDRGQIAQMLARNKADTLRAVTENQRRGGALIR